MGLITKPDALFKDSKDEKEYVKLASNEATHLRLERADEAISCEYVFERGCVAHKVWSPFAPYSCMVVQSICNLPCFSSIGPPSHSTQGCGQVLHLQTFNQMSQQRPLRRNSSKDNSSSLTEVFRPILTPRVVYLHCPFQIFNLLGLPG